MPWNVAASIVIIISNTFILVIDIVLPISMVVIIAVVNQLTRCFNGHSHRAAGSGLRSELGHGVRDVSKHNSQVTLSDLQNSKQAR